VRVVGRTPSQQGCGTGCWEGGYLVLQRTTGGTVPARVELSPHLSAPVVLGRITTAVSAALLLALAVAAAARRRRRRSAAHATGTQAEV
jgi:MYXO-CTERM domain-containing protein